MIVFWGKLVGLLLGVFGGPLGCAFGLLVGHLLDVVAGDFLLRREMSRFMSDSASGSPRQFDRVEALTALVVAAAAEPRWAPAPEDVRIFEAGLREWRGAEKPVTRRMSALLHRVGTFLHLIRDRLLHGKSGSYLDAALRLRADIDADQLVAGIMSEVPEGQRIIMFNVCISTLEATLTERVRERLRGFARRAEIADEWVVRALPPAARRSLSGGIDPEACIILEVKPDATLEDVKRAYRRLAAQFHPDTAAGLSEEQRDTSSQAFVRIQETYNRVIRSMQSGE